MFGIYAEMSGCAFDPSRDYSCYRIPTTANATCPAGVTPQASQACTVDPCMLCNSTGGLPGGHFNDAGGADKIGYCVCQPPNAAGVRTWSCASDTAWPCPAGAGCDVPGGRGGTGGGGRGGSPGTGGSTGGADGAGGTGGIFQPGCPGTVSKGGACLPTDIQFCYKPCGPENTGAKSDTCVGGVYVEMSGCAFDPSRDYSCYKIPTSANVICPAGVTPQASAACSVPACTLCNSVGGLPGGRYLDAAGADKIGYCVCREPNATGVRTWSCASDTAWPCPAGAGC
jgi:hypothetical protein